MTFVGPGHPIFEAVVHHVLVRFGLDLSRGAVLHDPAGDPAGEAGGLLWLLVGGVEDGLGRIAGKRLFALFQPLVEGRWRRISPARLLDFDPPTESPPLSNTCYQRLSDVDAVVDWSLDHVLDPYLAELQAEREKETGIVRDYLQRSFNVLIARSQGKLMEYEQKVHRGADMSLSLQEEHRHPDDLRRRQQNRMAEAERAAKLALTAPEVVGVAAIVPGLTSGVNTGSPGDVPMRRSDEVEEAAMARAMAYERDRGWDVEDISAENRGYDLISRGPGGRSPGEEIRYIEVKGRAGEGAVELSANEWLKAEQLGQEFWLYIVTSALTDPALHLVQDPAHRLTGEEVIPHVRYRVAQQGWHRVAEPGK